MTTTAAAEPESKEDLQWIADKIRLRIEVERANLDYHERWLARIEKMIDGLPD